MIRSFPDLGKDAARKIDDFNLTKLRCNEQTKFAKWWQAANLHAQRCRWWWKAVPKERAAPHPSDHGLLGTSGATPLGLRAHKSVTKQRPLKIIRATDRGRVNSANEVKRPALRDGRALEYARIKLAPLRRRAFKNFIKKIC